MKTTEIIHLRLAGSGPEDLVDIIRRSIGSAPELMDVRIYRHSKLKNDLAIHLHRETDKDKDGISDIGVRLTALLKDYGMVEHSIWTQCCRLEEGPGPQETGRQHKEG